ncbi:MAG: EAL domain-containing protein [Kineosporiaceae bacterium]
MSPVPGARQPAPRTSRIGVVGLDDADFSLLRGLLHSAGYQHVHGLGADPDLGDVLALDPDLLVVDLDLPGDGVPDLLLTLTSRVPDDDYLPMLVVDPRNPRESEPRRRRALQAGAHDYLPRPLDPSLVRLRVGTLLLTRDLHRRDQRANAELARLVRERTSAIDAERRFLRDLLDCLDVGILACGPTGDVVLHNAAFARLGVPPSVLGAPREPPAGAHSVTAWGADGRHELKPQERPLAVALRGERLHGEELVLTEDDVVLAVVVANAAPLLDDEGEPSGAVLALHDISERRHAEDELRRMALHDGLTGLPNRTLFLDRLDQALQRRRRDPRPVAVLFIDVDHFKVVNDTLGHAAGDDVLTRIADRLRRAVRPGDTAARLGGDEFVVLCEAPVDVASARRIAARIEVELSREMTLAGNPFTPQVSVGITVVDDDADRSATEVLRDADAAMFAAKQTGGGRHEVFDQILRGRLMERLDIAGSLQAAIGSGEITLHYQPTIDLTTGRICGAEALARWQRPGGETIPPDRFIPVAEQTGIITTLGQWVIDEACRQLAAWKPDLPEDFTLAVNLSARQLTHAGLVADVARTLDLTGVDPDRICLELTETALVDNAQMATRTLGDLRDLGLRLAVDDFGTGQSSLAYLRNFPISIVKIDREFVGGMTDNRADAAIVTAVVELGHRLGLVTQAEGVENPAQVAMLRELHCELAQGFYYSAAVPAATLRSMLVGL